MQHVFLVYSSLLMSVLTIPAHAEQNPAHALAQKFAVQDSKPAAKPAPAVKPAAVPAPQKAANQPPAKAAPAPSAQDDEQEMLKAARAEAGARNTQQRRAAPPEGAPTAPGTAAPQSARPAAPQAAVAAAQPPAPADPAQKQAGAANAATAKATVLVVLSQTGTHGTTFKTFDPIICFTSKCFISTGVTTDARAAPRDDALSTKNAVTAGAGACAGQMGCVFRGVTFDQGAPLQIIDLGLVNHKLHDPLEAKADTTCTLDESDLVCRKPLTAPDYRVWIVPEAIATQAGPEKLSAALDDELPEENVTLETDK